MEKQKKLQNKKQQNRHLKICNIKLDPTKTMGLNIKKENKYVIPIFIPHRGCKNECVFCNQKKISGETRIVTPDNVRDEIDTWLDKIKDKTKPVQVAFFGGSFTGLELAEQEEFLKIANEFISQKKVESIKISTRPDYITEEILVQLKKYNVKCIELGVQSMDEEVLLASKRGHTVQDVINASKLIKKYKFELGHQVMIGLPESTLEKEINTIDACIKLKPSVIRIYPVYVLKESKLYDMTISGEYLPLELKNAINRAKEVYKRCVKAKVNVIRIGLQTTEEINEKSENILGPVCDNYRERILSIIAREQVEKRLKKISKTKYTNIYVPKTMQSFVIGYNRENIECFEAITQSTVCVKCNK